MVFPATQSLGARELTLRASAQSAPTPANNRSPSASPPYGSPHPCLPQTVYGLLSKALFPPSLLSAISIMYERLARVSPCHHWPFVQSGDRSGELSFPRQGSSPAEPSPGLPRGRENDSWGRSWKTWQTSIIGQFQLEIQP